MQPFTRKLWEGEEKPKEGRQSAGNESPLRPAGAALGRGALLQRAIKASAPQAGDSWGARNLATLDGEARPLRRRQEVL